MSTPSEQLNTVDLDHEGRIGTLEGVAAQMDKRLDSIDRALTELRTGQRWIIGLIIVSFLGNLVLKKWGG